MPHCKQPTTNLMAVILYGGKENTWKAGLTGAELEEMEPERIQAADRVRELYSSGIPFFSKHVMADLVEQFDRARRHLQYAGTSQGSDEVESRGQMFFLQGLDGKTVEIENEMGTVWPTPGRTERVA